jgi:hypothetical protein
MGAPKAVGPKNGAPATPKLYVWKPTKARAGAAIERNTVTSKAVKEIRRMGHLPGEEAQFGLIGSARWRNLL